MDSTEGHRQRLEREHQALEKQLAAEMKRRLPDTQVLQTIKKRKLKIKEELSMMMEQPRILA